MFGNKRYYERTIESLQVQLKDLRYKETDRIREAMVARNAAHIEKRHQADLKAKAAQEKSEAVANYKYDLQQLVQANDDGALGPKDLVAHCTALASEIQEATSRFEQSLEADDE